MKVSIFITVCLLVGGIDAAHDVSLTATVCEAERCPCPPPREVTTENLQYNAELSCFCACGSKMDQECLLDIDCVHGLHCAAGDTISGKGKCKDACQKPGLNCDIFDHCDINEKGDAECNCNIRACSDKLIGSGVCSFDLKDDNAPRTFNNDCLFVNEQCKRRKEGKQKLQRQPVSQCAVEIQPRFPSMDILGGWRMSGI